MPDEAEASASRPRMVAAQPRGPQERAFRRIGVISFGVVGGSVVLAKIGGSARGRGDPGVRGRDVRPSQAITMLGVVVLMGEEMVDAMDASDPIRASHGGAYGPRLKRFFRDARHNTRTWFTSLPANVAALRHELTARVNGTIRRDVGNCPGRHPARRRPAARQRRTVGAAQAPAAPAARRDAGIADGGPRARNASPLARAPRTGSRTLVTIRVAGGGPPPDQGQVFPDASAGPALQRAALRVRVEGATPAVESTR